MIGAFRETGTPFLFFGSHEFAGRSRAKSDKKCCCKCGKEVAAKSGFEVLKGDVVKLVREIRMYDDEERKRVVKDKSVSG